MWMVTVENYYRKLIATLGSIFVIAMVTCRWFDGNNTNETDTQENSKTVERVMESAVTFLVMFIGVVVAGPRRRWWNNTNAVNSQLDRIIDVIMIMQVIVVFSICIGYISGPIGGKHSSQSSIFFKMTNENDTNDDFHVIFSEDITNLNLTEFIARNKVRSTS